MKWFKRLSFNKKLGLLTLFVLIVSGIIIPLFQSKNEKPNDFNISSQVMNNSPGGTQVQNLGGTTTVNISRNNEPTSGLMYQKRGDVNILKVDHYYHTVFDVTATSSDRDTLENLKIGVNYLLKCTETKLQGTLASSWGPNLLDDGSQQFKIAFDCISENPIADNGRLFYIYDDPAH